MPFELHEQWGYIRGHTDDSVQSGQPHWNADKRGDKDTDKHGAFYFVNQQCGGDNQTNDAEQRRACRDVAKGNQRGLAVNNHS